MIFKRVGEGRPYPDHSTTFRVWSDLPPRQVRLDELVTTKRTLDLDALLAEDSTFYGDLFAHVVEWRGELYLEDGLHRALRAALQQRPVIHARVLVLGGFRLGGARLTGLDLGAQRLTGRLGGVAQFSAHRLAVPPIGVISGRPSPCWCSPSS